MSDLTSIPLEWRFMLSRSPRGFQATDYELMEEILGSRNLAKLLAYETHTANDFVAFLERVARDKKFNIISVTRKAVSCIPESTATSML
jgi:hypothetical protein